MCNLSKKEYLKLWILLLLRSEVYTSARVFGRKRDKRKWLKRMTDGTDLYACHIRDKVWARDDESSICSFILRQLTRQWITMRMSDRRRVHAQIGSYISLSLSLSANQVLHPIHLVHLNEADRLHRRPSLRTFDLHLTIVGDIIHVILLRDHEMWSDRELD